MAKFRIQSHGRLQEWGAEEKGYFKEAGLEYEFLVKPIVTWAAGSLDEASDASRYFLIGIVLNVPRFLALGIAVGYFYTRSTTPVRPTEGPA